MIPAIGLIAGAANLLGGGGGGGAFQTALNTAASMLGGGGGNQDAQMEQQVAKMGMAAMMPMMNQMIGDILEGMGEDGE